MVGNRCDCYCRSFSGTSDGASLSALAMLEAKSGRKRAEGDLQLLANRIALLRLEEQKALSKVTETKVRAKDLLE
jgi:hypothetical protein